MTKTRFPGLLGDSLFDKHPTLSRTMTLPAGAPDSVAIAEAARECAEQGSILVVIAANASDVIRLEQEVAWVDPSLSVRTFPDWETLPYDLLSPHEDLISERLETLYRLSSRVPGRRSDSGTAIDLLLLSASTAALRIAPTSFISATTFFFRRGDILSTTDLKHRLILAGYSNVSQVMGPGEFCVRGEIVDIYPMGAPNPYRIGLFDDEIETIRVFDENTQHTTGDAESIRILPGREFPID